MHALFCQLNELHSLEFMPIRLGLHTSTYGLCLSKYRIYINFYGSKIRFCIDSFLSTTGRRYIRRYKGGPAQKGIKSILKKHLFIMSCALTVLGTCLIIKLWPLLFVLNLAVVDFFKELCIHEVFKVLRYGILLDK